MKQDDRLSGALQENILCLLCFDDANCKLVRAAVSPQLFESSVFKEVAGHAIDFIDQYGEAIKDHLPDHIEHILKGDDARKAKTYERLLENLYASKDSVNGEYVITQLHKFVRMQNFKSALVQAVERVEDGDIDGAEVVMQKGMVNQAVVFEAGLSLSSPSDVQALLEDSEEEGVPLGIEELDRLGIMPRRKELLFFLAPRGKGKSWFITHAAKNALLWRWSTVIITLEMSERNYGVRMLQSFFSIGRNKAEVMVSRFTRDGRGNLEDIIQEKMEQRLSIKDDDAKPKLIKRAGREFNRRPKFRIKQFPMRSLTIAGLEAYLDGLERFENFTPDLICIDYPALMNIDSKNMRLEYGHAVEAIRGIATKRNAAAIVVGQGNRESETASTVTGDMAAEDISLLATADVFITYSQTAAEYALGLARLFVEKSRNTEAKMSVLLTQAYAVGQFCLDSIRLKSDYWTMMQGKAPDSKGGDNEPQRRRRQRDPE